MMDITASAPDEALRLRVDIHRLRAVIERALGFVASDEVREAMEEILRQTIINKEEGNDRIDVRRD